MKFIRQRIPDVVLIEPRVFGDDRGYFMEIWHAGKFAEAGLDLRFVQDNQSYSRVGTLRGLHYQVRARAGEAGAGDQRTHIRRRGGPAALLSQLRPVGRRHAFRREQGASFMCRPASRMASW